MLDSLSSNASASSSSPRPDAPVVVPPPSQGKGWLGGPEAFEASLSVPVFSRRREVFVGRAAMAGFYASCMWEVRRQVKHCNWLVSSLLPLCQFLVSGRVWFTCMFGVLAYVKRRPGQLRGGDDIY
jgi:hypothetical protein